MKKKPIFSSNEFKNKDFFKISKTDDDFNSLAKFVEQFFPETHLIQQKVQKTLFL
jgi:hypothetical protein